MLTVSFRYVYDHAKNAFNIRNEGTTYTVSQLSWQFLKDYEVYNFEFKDIKNIEIKTGKETNVLKPVIFSFDVSIEGQFVRNCNIDYNVVRNT